MRLLLFLVFLIVPLLEVWVLIQVGQVIGGWPTVGLLLVAALLGAWLIRREGRRVWRAVNESLAAGRIPDRELGDAALVLTGGMLLITPGFVTDLAGLACVLPVTRPLVRGVARWFFAQRLRGQVATPPFAVHTFGTPEEPARGPVIRGQVIREDTEDDPRPRPRLP